VRQLHGPQKNQIATTTKKNLHNETVSYFMPTLATPGRARVVCCFFVHPLFKVHGRKERNLGIHVRRVVFGSIPFTVCNPFSSPSSLWRRRTIRTDGRINTSPSSSRLSHECQSLSSRVVVTVVTLISSRRARASPLPSILLPKSHTCFLRALGCVVQCTKRSCRNIFQNLAPDFYHYFFSTVPVRRPHRCLVRSRPPRTLRRER
jgi:hypothetical protein